MTSILPITEDIFCLKNHFQLETEREAIFILYQNDWQLDRAINDYELESHQYYEENDIIKEMDWEEFISYMMQDFYYSQVQNREIPENPSFFRRDEYIFEFPRRIEDYIMADYCEEVMDKTLKIECPICYEEIKGGLSTDCIHKFCKRCISDWIIKFKKDFCPMCKKEDISLFEFNQ